jgi:hypothetical protein
MEGGVDKTDISRAAAARAIEALEASDEIGLLAFNGAQNWLIPMQQLPTEDVVREGLRRLHPSGSTDIEAGLRVAAAQLRESSHQLRHIIVFTDGFSSTLFPGFVGPAMPSGPGGPGGAGGASAPPPPLVEQARQLAEEGITVSVVATGESPAFDQLAAIAEAGHGRFYPGRNLSEIPQIFVDEARLVSRNFINEGEFYPAVSSTSAVVRNLTAAPPVLGYIATTPKPTTETLLQVGELADPLLATWRVGLGRVTSWTSDASARWSQQWASWDGYADFWAGVVKDTFALEGAGGTALRARIEGGDLTVSLEAETPWPDGSVAAVDVAGPDGDHEQVPLERVSDTEFRVSRPASDQGTYAAGVSLTGADGAPILTTSALATQSYPPEYLPGDPDVGALARVSELADGRGEISAASAFDPAGLEAGVQRRHLGKWLLLAAALLWPLDVILRRMVLRSATAPLDETAHRRRPSRWSPSSRWSRSARSAPRPPGRAPGAGPPLAPTRARRRSSGSRPTTPTGRADGRTRRR